jgi:hypothetical protein
VHVRFCVNLFSPEVVVRKPPILSSKMNPEHDGVRLSRVKSSTFALDPDRIAPLS